MLSFKAKTLSFSMQEKKRVFITGISGFIGFHLALYLKKKGDEVFGCDNFNDYYDPALKRARALLLHEEGIPIIEGDICTLALAELFQCERITHVVNLAAQAGVRHSILYPHLFIESNIKGFTSILEACKNIPGIHLTYASSSSVYGEREKVPFSENEGADQPASLYGATKKANELLAATYHHLYQIPMAGLRYFTVYGPWGRPDMAYFKFAKAIKQGQPIDLFNSGNMERDFTYIDDIVAGTAAAMNLSSGHEIFNLGNEYPEKLMTMVEILENLLEKEAIKRYLPMQPGDVTKTYSDIAKAKKMLGFSPNVNLQEGLSRFVTWFAKSDERSYLADAR
jgi:UDP-glucuronate 4-epimerase